ncbi:MAG: hypothetical protein ABSF35_01555 [Polyangia bacterium]
MGAPDRKFHEHFHGARSALAVFLAATLASWPAQAQPPAPAPSAPPAAPVPAPPAGPVAPSQPYAPGFPPAPDPWLQSPPAGVPGPTPASPGPAVGMPVPPAYPSPYQSPAGWPYQAPMPNPYGPGGVYVEVRTSSSNVRIDRVLAPGSTMTVCFAPCRKILPRNSVYVITGDGVRSTSNFILPDDRDRIILDVKAGSTWQGLGGGVLVGLGVVVTYVGLGLLLVGTSTGTDSDVYSTSSSKSGSLTTAGGVMLAGGILAGLLGLYLLSDSHTSVKSSTGAQFSGTPAPPRKRARFALTARGLEF